MSGAQALALGEERYTERRHTVMEVFGPTVQGEGPLVGAACCFVRFGGCDYRCSWCDSKFAVDPAQVREQGERLTDDEVLLRLGALGTPERARWVVLSGGNPALQHLGTLVPRMQRLGYRVQIETQGTVWRPWMMTLDHVVVSPKPPSSGNTTTIPVLERFVRGMGRGRMACKVVVFDDVDYRYARDVARACRSWGLEMFLSVGNPETQTPATEELRGLLLDRYEWLIGKVLGDTDMGDVRVLPQLHALVWGNRRGV